MDDRVLTTAEAAEMAGVSVPSVTEWIKSGQLPAEQLSSRGGRPGLGIKESDLTAFNRRRLLGPANATATGAMLLTDADRRADALSLEVLWPDQGKSAAFSTALFEGYSEFRAVTYTASLETIMKLLISQQFERVEVIFGSEGLLKGKEYPLLVQQAINDIASRDFIGLGGSKSPVTQALLEHQSSGRLSLMAMAPGVVHSKYYLLAGKAGRRVMVGSANLSERAMSGKQGEILFAYDDHPYVWDVMSRKYEALAALASQAPVKLETEVKPAHLLTAADLPAFHKVKEGEPVPVFVPAAAPASGNTGDHPALLARIEDLARSFGPTLATNLRPNKDGVAEVTPAVVKNINRDLSAQTLKPEVKPSPRVDFVGTRFIFNGKAVEPSDDAQAVANDAYYITRFFNTMREFGPGAATMQRNYFGFMGWMFFAPFMCLARRERCKESPKNTDFKLLALIYGAANTGKSTVVGFLQAAMFGDQTSYSDKGNRKFTPSDCLKLRNERGVLPIFFDDISGHRFANARGGETAGEQIAKAYDLAQNEGNEFYPCLVAAMNLEAREFSTPVRKRCLMVYANQSVPEDDAGLIARLNAEITPLMHRIGTAFYAEYLTRMETRLRQINPGEWMQFDYLLESTSLIRDLLDENRGEGEDMPLWRRPVGWQEYDESSWELKRAQLRNELIAENWTDEYPPALGRWTLRGGVISLGVDDYRAALRRQEYPSQILDDTACHSTVMGFNKDATVAMLKRGDETYELPRPADETARPGLFTRLRQALR